MRAYVLVAILASFSACSGEPTIPTAPSITIEAPARIVGGPRDAGGVFPCHVPVTLRAVGGDVTITKMTEVHALGAPFGNLTGVVDVQRTIGSPTISPGSPRSVEWQNGSDGSFKWTLTVEWEGGKATSSTQCDAP